MIHKFILSSFPLYKCVGSVNMCRQETFLPLLFIVTVWYRCQRFGGITHIQYKYKWERFIQRATLAISKKLVTNVSLGVDFYSTYRPFWKGSQWNLYFYERGKCARTKKPVIPYKLFCQTTKSSFLHRSFIKHTYSINFISFNGYLSLLNTDESNFKNRFYRIIFTHWEFISS